MRRRTRTTRPRAGAVSAVVAVSILGALSGCGAMEPLLSPEDGAHGPAPSSATSPVPPPAPPAVPSVDTVRSTGTPVDVDGTVVLHVLAAGGAPAVRVEPDGDQTALTLDPGDPGATVDVLLAAPAGATLDPQDDDSLVVLGADGAFLGGASRPLLGPGATPARLERQADGAVRLVSTGTLTVRLGDLALAGYDWGQREGGRSLAVEPTPWARAAGIAGEVGVWTELVRAVPEADVQHMRDQLACHVLGAPDKDTWNLEPWRPDVGMLMTLAAACNPT